MAAIDLNADLGETVASLKSWNVDGAILINTMAMEIDELREALLETPANPHEEHAQARMREMYELISLVGSRGWAVTLVDTPGDEARDEALLEQLLASFSFAQAVSGPDREVSGSRGSYQQR